MSAHDGQARDGGPGPDVASRLSWLIEHASPPGKKLSDRKIARMASRSLGRTVTGAAVGKLRMGQVKDPYSSTVAGLAAALGVPVAYFLGTQEEAAAIAEQVEEMGRLRAAGVTGVHLRSVTTLEPSGEADVVLARLQDLGAGDRAMVLRLIEDISSRSGGQDRDRS